MSVATASPQQTSQGLTATDLWQRGQSTPGELVRGRFLDMPPTGHTHSSVEANVAAELQAFVKQRALGKLMSGEVGIITQRNPDTVRGADVVDISHERLAHAQTDGYLDIAPDLVIEVVSPNDRWSETYEKIGEYLGCGVRAVWIIDPRTQRVTCYHPPTDVRVYGADDVLTAPELLPELAVAIRKLFE